LALIGTVAVIDLVAVIVEGAHGLTKIRGEKNRWVKAVSLGILGGLFGIYATATGYTMDNGAVISLRDVGAMMAGCLGGPLAGAIAGTIAGVHRLFYYYPDLLGGTSIPCAISTLLIGVLCGLLAKPFDKLETPVFVGFVDRRLRRSPSPQHRVLLCLGDAGDRSGWQASCQREFPFILANSVAFGVMIYTRDMIGKYKATELHAQQVEKRTRHRHQHSVLDVTEDLPGFPGPQRV
jgi:LytS/YehU family sensor histidine kinase